MAEALTSFTIAAQLQATLQNTIDGTSGAAQCSQGFQWTKPTWSSGTGANAADKIWSDTGRALSSGGSENIDMYDLASIDIGAGAGKSALGQSVALAEVVAILIISQTTSAGNLLIGGEGSAAAWNSAFNASDTAVAGPFPPGAFWFICSPYDPAFTVTDSSNHLLKIAASGGAVTYNIAILGRSA